MQLKVEDKENSRDWTFTMSDTELCEFICFLIGRIDSKQPASQSLHSLLSCSNEVYNELLHPIINKVCPFLNLVIVERRRLGRIPSIIP